MTESQMIRVLQSLKVGDIVCFKGIAQPCYGSAGIGIKVERLKKSFQITRTHGSNKFDIPFRFGRTFMDALSSIIFYNPCSPFSGNHKTFKNIRRAKKVVSYFGEMAHAVEQC